MNPYATLKFCEKFYYQIKQQLTLINSNSNDENIAELENWKSKYEAAYDYITSGAVLRSQAKWYEEGEKTLNIFLT